MLRYLETRIALKLLEELELLEIILIIWIII